MAKIGTQPMVNATAYHLGLNCPIGQEVVLTVGLQTLWPELPLSNALEMFFDGLADRYKPEAERVPRGWDGKPLPKQRSQQHESGQ